MDIAADAAKEVDGGAGFAAGLEDRLARKSVVA
jgi:hypothetical protein